MTAAFHVHLATPLRVRAAHQVLPDVQALHGLEVLEIGVDMGLTSSRRRVPAASSARPRLDRGHGADELLPVMRGLDRVGRSLTASHSTGAD